MSENGQDTTVPLQRTPLHGLHLALGAHMVAFAGYEMPVQYAPGILAEHAQVRSSAGLFDVSHMGQAWLEARTDVAGALERLVPGDIRALPRGGMRYTQLLADDGGIIDDLMVVRPANGERLLLIVNAACKEADYAYIGERLAGLARLEPVAGLALLALQGPAAAAVLTRICPAAGDLGFMSSARLALDGISCLVCRSGYTGEDGFEISVPGNRARLLAERLLGEPEVAPVGLGARDSLRLEAGFCLYGHDIDRTTSPVEAGLAWSIGKRRRAEGGFAGAKRVLAELAGGARRQRIGLRPEGRQPVREGAPILDSFGMRIGTVTSGGYSPTLGAPVAMGYVAPEQAVPDTRLRLEARGKPLAATVARLPFVPHRYHRL